MTKLNPSTRNLLARAKKVDGPSRHAQTQIYRALTGTAVSAAVTLGVTSAEASFKASATANTLLTLLTTGKLGIVTSVVVGMVSGTLVLTGVARLVPHEPTPKSHHNAAVAPPPKPLSLAAHAAAPTVTSVDLPEPSVDVVLKKVAPLSPLPNPSRIAEETRVLAMVQQALRENDGQRALRLLGLYRRDFAKGALGEEALAAEVFARCAVGDVSGAADARSRFRRQFVGSPLEPRVESSCADGGDNVR